MIVGGVVFYAVCVLSKDSRKLVLPRTSFIIICFSVFLMIILICADRVIELVGVVVGYWLDGPGLIPGIARFFVFSIASRLAVGPTQSHIQWGLGVTSQGVKRPSREADLSPPSSAKVKNSGALLPLPYTSSWHSA
jgi:hypothetical protein